MTRGLRTERRWAACQGGSHSDEFDRFFVSLIDARGGRSRSARWRHAARAVDLDSLAARVQVLEDREAIRALILAYGQAHDHRDYKTFASLFAANGEWVGGLGSAKGPEAIFALMDKTIGHNPLPNGSGTSRADQRSDRDPRRPRIGRDEVDLPHARATTTRRSSSTSATTTTSSSARTASGSSCVVRRPRISRRRLRSSSSLQDLGARGAPRFDTRVADGETRGQRALGRLLSAARESSHPNTGSTIGVRPLPAQSFSGPRA